LFGYRNWLPKGYFLANRKPTASTKLSLQWDEERPKHQQHLKT
jgi:hypothetical protein